MAMLKIDNVDIKTPSKFSVALSDIDGETTRNANGEMIRDRIATKHKLECEWAYLTQSEISTLLTAVQNTFFTVTFPDPKEGIITKTMYVGDRTSPVYKYGTGGSQLLWEGLKMNFIEK